MMRRLGKVRKEAVVLGFALLVSGVSLGCDNGGSSSVRMSVEHADDRAEADVGEALEKSLAERVPEQERAARFVFDFDDGLAGQLEEGDRIDLLATYHVDANGEVGGDAPLPYEDTARVMTVLQNLRILDAAVREEDETKSVGLIPSLTPEEQELLQAMRRDAALSVTLRGREDADLVPVQQRRAHRVFAALDGEYRNRRNNFEEVLAPCDDAQGEDARACVLDAIGQDGASASIPKGYRALTLSLAVSAEFLKPGDLIDLLGTFPMEALGDDGQVQTSDYFTMEVLQNAAVLQARSGDREASLVTIVVSPQEAERLRLVEDGGELSVLIRPPGAVGFRDPIRRAAQTAFDDIDLHAEERQARYSEYAPSDLSAAGPAFTSPEEELLLALPTSSLSAASLRPQPGDWIDIVATFFVDGQEEPTALAETVKGRSHVAMTLIERVKVVDADPSRLMVSVTPKEAKVLELARTRGEFDLNLRHPADTTIETGYRRSRSMEWAIEEVCCGRAPEPEPNPCHEGYYETPSGECIERIEIVR